VVVDYIETFVVEEDKDLVAVRERVVASTLYNNSITRDQVFPKYLCTISCVTISTTFRLLPEEKL
jgi:hypothetical protein